MSFDIVKTLDFPQATFQYVPQELSEENAIKDIPTIGGILSDLKHLWHAKGPSLEVRNTTSGRKVGSWTFGGILKDANTRIVAVDELKRPHGRLSLLLVALECTISGGLIAVFDIFGSKVLRVVHIREQITSVHVIDSGCENSVLPEPSPLRYFDGIVAVGALGGNVYLVDLCRQICEVGLQNADSAIRDELNPCPMVILNKEKVANIKKYVERSVDREEHLAIHINVVLNPSTEHFTLKGENSEDRVHVNRAEAEVSSLFYSPQIASLLVGYNFGAFQLWDLRSLQLAYTSPICEEHIPVMHFTVQEPADDPKAYCYIWVSYSHNLRFHSGLPFAVMYSFYYEHKNYVNGYGNLYEDFQHCSVRFQIELGDTDTYSRVKGGTCLGLQSLNRYPINRDLHSLSLCLISWLVWNSHKEVKTSVLVFDLNQWYKEQMPRIPNWSHCSNYIIKNSMNTEVLDVQLDQKSLSQFIGIQRLEEHFCPTALSFDLWCITDNNILKVHKKGSQKAFLDKIVNDQHLSLVRSEDYFEQITNLGLVPLFCEIHLNNSLDVDYQREILLNVALEQKLVGWLCTCTSKLANNAFNASGLTIYNILNWAFDRAITLKNSCDKYCVSLFDFSGTRLDNNTIILIRSSTGQIRNICSIYKYVSSRLMHFVSDKASFLEEQRSLENVVVYFEVLLWMVNIGLLPECQLSNCRSYDDSFTSAPYLVNDLTQYYNRKRAQLQMASHDTFVEKDCLLFIDNLINVRGGAELLRQHWQEDGGSGLYPPPSLQSVLRTYFLDGPDLDFKHSLVTYTLLDIAMTVDENNKIIKLLLKFPQIFDLSQSKIKIVQAFWHLDHDDYKTALEYILDPCVRTEDLHHWDHSVMMRSLLLQDQSSLALLYLQIRKPSMQDAKDLLTVISLLISKNMLDEAFKFRQQHQNLNEHALLTHIFNECNKNELLHSLLYRRLNDGEEQAFFKYLQNMNNPRCEDLRVFYYLLRSRFLEAFDSYSATRRTKPESQGLIGQRDATTADNIVKLFKTLLPDVNKNLVELVRKERTNLWKEVKKPTPLSVFVHNARDQVQYKSSVIFAALAKAKQTFNDTLNDTRTNGDVVTEETPFLRTPTAFRNVLSVGTPLMRSKVIEQNELGEEYGPSPCKKLKLSPRASRMSPVKSRNVSLSTIQSRLSTPIIRRQRLPTEASNRSAMLPQSILKGSSMSRTILDDSILSQSTSVNTSLQLECENSVRRSRLALSPRKPVSRTPFKSHVKFDDLRYSNSSNEQSSSKDNSLNILIPESTIRQSIDSTASTIDEPFYSPENSPEKTPTGNVDKWDIEKTSLLSVKENLSFDETVVEDDLFVKEPPKKTKIPVEEDDLSTNRLTFQSPRSRRSYKRSFGESPVPVRSSPRLAEKAFQEDLENKEDTTLSETDVNKSEMLINPSPSIALQKIKGRKSLSRVVLENNTFSQLKPNSVEEKSFLESKSGYSSVNTTASDFDSEMDLGQSYSDSLQELLAKYRANAQETDTSFNTNNSLLSDDGVEKDSDALKTREVISNITEIQSIACSESVRKADTQVVVFSEETREEYQSKEAETFDNNHLQEPGKEHPLDIFDEATQDLKMVIKKDEQSETEEGTEEKCDEINIYDDLSSGSEDVREVLKQFRPRDNNGKLYSDISFSTSASYYQNERKDELMPQHLMESGNSNSNASETSQHVYDNDIDMDEFYDDIPVTERAFVDSEEVVVGSGDVIEIGSSSDEDDKRKEINRETDENSESTSSSEEKSDSSKDAYEIDEEKSTDEDDVPQERTTGSIENSNIEDDGLDEELEPITKEFKLSGESSESSYGDEASSHIERQFELEQKEIAIALKMLQTDTLAEGLHPEEEDKEQMDSLILEEHSLDQELQDNLEPTIVGEDSVVIEVQLAKNVQINTEDFTLQENKATAEDLKKQEPSVDPLQQSKNLTQTLDDGDLESVESKNRTEPLEAPAPTLKQSTSLQCTLGINDTLMESCAEDNDSVAQVDDDKVDPKSQEETLKLNIEGAPSSLKRSRSIQCTLSIHDSLVDSFADYTSVFLKDDENADANKDQVASDDLVKKGSGFVAPVDDDQVEPKSEEQSLELTIERASSSLMQSRSIQCTLGIHDSLIDSFGDCTSVLLKDHENVNLNRDQVSSENKAEDLDTKGPSVTIEKSFKRPQCTLEGESIMDISNENDVSISLAKDPRKDQEITPLVLRTVKKTYAGRKASEQSDTLDPDATPKLSKKESNEELNTSMEEDTVPRNVKEHTGRSEEDSVTKEMSEVTSAEKEHSVSTSNDGDSKLGSTLSQEDGSKGTNEETVKAAPVMRLTRRRSLLLSQQDGTPSSTSEKSVGGSSGDVSKEPSIENTPQPGIPQTPISRKKRLSQLTDSESPVIRADLDSMDASPLDSSSEARAVNKLDADQDKPGPSKIRSRRSSKNSTRNEPPTSLKQDLKKRTRSLSVDQPSTSIRKRSIRSKSIDLDDMKDVTIAKTTLRVILTPIPEQGPSTSKDAFREVPKQSTKAYSDVGAYTTSRRLTRKQARMLKTIGKVEDEIKKLDSIEEIDPVHLLDKSEFTGNPDPDESNVYEQVSPSNSSETASRHTRSASVLSDVPGTPTKKTSRTKSDQVNVTVSGIKSRLRKQSTDTMSVTSEQSDSPSPSKRVKKEDHDKEDQNNSQSVKSGRRGRATSVSSTKSAASDNTDASVRTTRSRKLTSKNELPEIEEEKNTEGEESIDTTMVKKRGRKKKN